MRITVLPSYWEPEKGITPIDAQDVDFQLSIDELEALAAFMLRTAKTWRELGVIEASTEFGDSKPDAQTGIWVTLKA